MTGNGSARRRAVPLESRAERATRGRAVRRRVSRSALGEWSAPAGRPDPLAVLADQERTRVDELLPIRRGRMVASPFAFFRGAAAVMAADLAGAARTGLGVQLCGDAHLLNFGGFASPERDLVFDVNDFDETHPGPFEWDVKRLVASLEVAARDRGFDEGLRSSIVAWGARSYREAIRELATLPVLNLWYAKLDLEGIATRWGRSGSESLAKDLGKLRARAESRNHLKAFKRLVRKVDGQLRFVSDPPLLVPISEIFTGAQGEKFEASLSLTMATYRRSLSAERRHLYDRFRLVDMARKVVGVGSVGTRCWVALVVGHDEDDPVFLQVKEAEASVLEAHLGPSRLRNHGQRVVEGQRYMQAASDIMLGWCRALAPDDVQRDFYVRQLWDWKISGNIEVMAPSTMLVYAQVCGWTLARAHARSGDAVAIASYLGASPTFDRAMVRFATAYADQNEHDHARLSSAVRQGELVAELGV